LNIFKIAALEANPSNIMDSHLQQNTNSDQEGNNSIIYTDSNVLGDVGNNNVKTSSTILPSFDLINTTPISPQSPTSSNSIINNIPPIFNSTNDGGGPALTTTTTGIDSSSSFIYQPINSSDCGTTTPGDYRLFTNTLSNDQQQQQQQQYSSPDYYNQQQQQQQNYDINNSCGSINSNNSNNNNNSNNSNNIIFNQILPPALLVTEPSTASSPILSQQFNFPSSYNFSNTVQFDINEIYQQQHQQQLNIATNSIIQNAINNINNTINQYITDTSSLQQPKQPQPLNNQFNQFNQ